MSARIAEQAFYELDAPVERVCGAEVPVPYPHHLEEAALPQPAHIVVAARRAVGVHVAEFRMPSLGADMESGTLVEWLVKVGDPVRRGDIVAVVETPKSTVEVECFDTGTVEELVVEEGQRVPVGEVLAILGGRRSAGCAIRGTRLGAGARGAPPRCPLRSGSGCPLRSPRGCPLRSGLPAGRGGVGPGDAAEPAARRPLSPEPPHLARSSASTRRPSTARGERSADPSRRRARRGCTVVGDRGRASRRAPDAPATPEADANPRPRWSDALAGTMGPPVTMAGPTTVREAPETAHRLRVSPLARRLAAEQGVDLATVTGTGPEGTIRADDVRRAGRHTAPVGLGPAPARPGPRSR